MARRAIKSGQEGNHNCTSFSHRSAVTPAYTMATTTIGKIRNGFFCPVPFKGLHHLPCKVCAVGTCRIPCLFRVCSSCICCENRYCIRVFRKPRPTRTLHASTVPCAAINSTRMCSQNVQCSGFRCCLFDRSQCEKVFAVCLLRCLARGSGLRSKETRVSLLPGEYTSVIKACR